MNSIDTSTVAVNQSVSPIVAIKEEDKSVLPLYIWRTGSTFYVSKKEWVVAETYLKTRSYVECERALRREGFDRTWQSCRRWLERSHVKEYMVQRMEELGVYAGWTKERWYKVMTDHLKGTERLKNGDLYGMKLIAEYKGRARS